MCLLVRASITPTCIRDKEEHVQKMVNMSGVYQLEAVQNYGEYLMAMDIPERVVRHMEKFKLVNFNLNRSNLCYFICI